jgi:dTDP-glucose 4,6-dehydratase
MKGCDTVFHLGALIGIPYSYQNPNHVFLTNTQGTLNVLLAARDLGTERIVHTSTSEVYGTARIIPINEEHPLQAQSPYSASKIAADKIAESFYCSFNTPVVTVRPFNTYGPRQSARAVIPTIISQALAGGEIKLGMLDSRRDFTYVNDTVNGFILAAQTAGVEGNVFNLGVGEDNTVGEIADMIFMIVKEKKGGTFEAKIQQDTNRLRPQRSEVMRLISDNSKAKRLLNWQPQITLEQGLRQTVQWIENNPQFFRAGVYEV